MPRYKLCFFLSLCQTPFVPLQGASSRAARPSQVFLLTHRAEEIVDGVTAISTLALRDRSALGAPSSCNDGGGGSVGRLTSSVVTTVARQGRKAEDFFAAFSGAAGDIDPRAKRSPLPSLAEVRAAWSKSAASAGSKRVDGVSGSDAAVVVDARGLRVAVNTLDARGEVRAS